MHIRLWWGRHEHDKNVDQIDRGGSGRVSVSGRLKWVGEVVKRCTVVVDAVRGGLNVADGV